MGHSLGRSAGLLACCLGMIPFAVACGDDEDAAAYVGGDVVPPLGGQGGGAGARPEMPDASAGAGGELPGFRLIDDDEDGFSLNGGGDCDDADPRIFPGADEVPYDGIDQDCSGSDLVDLDGDGVPGVDLGDGIVDCDDHRADVNPQRREVPFDGVDQDCNGSEYVGQDEFARVGSPAAVQTRGMTIAAGRTAEGDPVGLVAWADSRNAVAQDIYVQFVDEDGSTLGDEMLIPTANEQKGGVRLASKGDGYLLTWHQANGVWMQRLDAAGQPEGAALGVSGAGCLYPAPAFGGTNWAVASLCNDEEVHIRGMSTGGARTADITVASGASIENVALAGGDESFLVLWDGEGSIHAEIRSATAESVETAAFILGNATAGDPAAAFDGQEYLVAYRSGASRQQAEAVRVDAEGDQLGQPQRLSDLSPTIAQLEVIPVTSGYYVAWNDARHTTASPFVSAVYGNAVTVVDGASSSSLAVEVPGGEPLHVGPGADLGGAARVGDSLIIASSRDGQAGLVVW